MNPGATLLKQYCDILLDQNTSWIERKQCLENMHALFVQQGALDVYDQKLRTDAATVAGGTAIAPTWAGMCLFDIARTLQFVKGLKQAITDRLPLQQGTPLQVLDAGCGPYGLLSLLCACYFSPRQVQFTLLDIFPANIESTRTLIAALHMQEHFKDLVCADATTYTWPKQIPLHILVTETMNRALWKEPQVAISLHLSPQLAPGGILIPAGIEVSLVCINGQKTKALQQVPAADGTMPVNRSEVTLGLLLTLNKQSTAAQLSQRPLTTVSLPAGYNGQDYALELHTQINIYKEAKLCSNESAITLTKPIRLSGEFSTSEVHTISFYYKMDDEPGLQW